MIWKRNKRAFSSAGSTGDWQSWSVGFTPTFSEKPVVFVTPNGDEPNAAVVGIAANITKSGFRLSARNSDNKAGSAGFSWIAIGPVSVS